jgi:tetratricopeptide (TPR) repeat protein
MFGHPIDPVELPRAVLARPADPPEPAAAAPPAENNPPLPPAENNLPLPDVHPPPVRTSNASSRSRAARLIQIGARHFMSERFHTARERFKDAAQAAPDLAEAHFQQGHALLAMKQFERAATAYRQGLLRNPRWPQSGFCWRDVYGDNELLKKNHLEELALRVAENPLSGDLLFVMGLWLYFDGNPDRARSFFDRAKPFVAEPRLVELFLAAPQDADRMPPAQQPPASEVTP